MLDMNMTAYYSHSGREDLIREVKKLEKSYKSDSGKELGGDDWLGNS